MAEDISRYEGCKKIAQTKGAVVDDWPYGCFIVYGKRIEINDTENDIMAGFEIVNFNFHVNGTAAAVEHQMQLPGPADPSQKTA